MSLGEPLARMLPKRIDFAADATMLPGTNASRNPGAVACSTSQVFQPFRLLVRKNSRLTISPSTANPERNRNTC